MAGALLHVWNHGAYKTLLFFSAGSVMHATGTREMSRLGGLWRMMPWTAGSFAVGAVAVAGLPPLNGFVSEWMICVGLFDAVIGKHSSAWAAMPALIMLAMSGALTLTTFAKAGAVIFLGAPRTKPAANARECGVWMRGPMVALAGVCMVLGLVPVLLWPSVTNAVGAWYPGWSGAEPAVPLLMLGRVNCGLVVVMAAAAFLIWRKVRANGLRRGPTWDCGCAAPTARMQYSSGSFAGLAAGWFWWILRPVRSWRRPRGYFAAEAIRLERVPETVLELVILPVGVRIMRVSSAVRRLQHGRLSAYILYVVAGLAALATMVMIESTR